MPDQKDPPAGPAVSKRGDAAWKAQRDAIDARNDNARREARGQRAAHEEHLQNLRRTAELARQASVKRHADDIAARRAAR